MGLWSKLFGRRKALPVEVAPGRRLHRLGLRVLEGDARLLADSRRRCGDEHPETTQAAWELWKSSRGLAPEEAEELLKRELAMTDADLYHLVSWLLSRDPAELSDSQNDIRRILLEQEERGRELLGRQDP